VEREVYLEQSGKDQHSVSGVIEIQRVRLLVGSMWTQAIGKTSLILYQGIGLLSQDI